eukprot:TRINITY_DN13984_c0_g1_i1.p1 TRINITY_DN13984_c0_g1~~TRINITY_DN13984_c0_g1_i1.p1  ORF type:complete len:243 (-),score=71.93 TRINITY_DN13984_c0_g1_i1:302-964(-)
MAAASVASMLEFVDICAKLKATKRTGWVRRGVQGAESVADHSFRLAMMAMALGKEAKVDVGKAVQMGLVHDLAESIVGDLVVDGEQKTRDKITREEKEKLEREAMKKICSLAGGVGEQILALWEEFEAGESPEALFVKDLDKLEMIAQARHYEKEQPEVDLSDFYRSTSTYSYKTTVCKDLDQEVRLQKRERLLKDGKSSAEAQVPGLVEDGPASKKQKS